MAGLIPQHFIQELLTRTDIVQVIGERLQLKKAGKEYMALSPFTNEKTPSFTVSPQKQFYHCFSSGKHGTAITFLMEYDRLSFPEAVEELARRAGLQVPREGGSAAPAPVLDGPRDALALAERYYKAELKKSPKAIDYLKQRGVSGETAKRFGIGYAPAGWDGLKSQFKDPRHAIDAGLLVKNDQGRVYDFFRDRVMFPVRDTRGRVITFGGRVLPGSDDNRKYLNGRETPLFDKGRNLYGLYEARQGTGAIPFLLVVEGYMDVVMLAQHGLTCAVATMGTATTREHLNLLFKSTSRVVFCFDGDRAGRAAAWKALEQALPEVSETRECRFMFLPDGHDPDTLVQEIGADGFRAQVEEAQPLSSFLLGELSARVNLSMPEGRARLAASARTHLQRMRQGALQDLIIDQLERMTRLTRAELLAAPTPVAPKAAGPSELDSAAARPVRRALQLLLERPDLAAGAADLDTVATAEAPGIELLVQALEYFREHPGASAARLLELWREDARGAALDAVAATRLDLAEDALEAEFRDALAHLAHRGRQKRAHDLLASARRRELTQAEKEELELLTRELKGLSTG